MRDAAPLELDLLRRARAGDEAAFRALVDGERVRARAVAWRLTRDPAAADEITQDAFVRLHRALPDFRHDASVATWLYRTIVNLSHDRGRRAERQARAVPLEELVEMPGSDSAADAAEAAERNQHVDAAVAALPAPMRDVVVLRYVRGLGYDEIAEVLQCPPGTVASRIHRALRAIGALLASQGIREGSL